jgi:hypothetical protein
MEEDYTHVYVHLVLPDEWGGQFCNTPLKLHRFYSKDRSSNTWVTTHATNHISCCHKEHAVADEDVKNSSSANSKNVAQMIGVNDD